MTVHIINPDDPKIDPEHDLESICKEIDNLLVFLSTRYNIDVESICQVTLARLKVMSENIGTLEDFKNSLQVASEWK